MMRLAIICLILFSLALAAWGWFVANPLFTGIDAAQIGAIGSGLLLVFTTGLSGGWVWGYLSRKKINQNTFILETKTQQAQLGQSLAEDRVQVLEAKIQTLELALNQALKR
ncbi:MAG: hypothetical protein VKJ06_03445 [Vampirovibrionales bacterium]|nr:hypothetical protein [Vampirovibrionales bacterium]